MRRLEGYAAHLEGQHNGLLAELTQEREMSRLAQHSINELRQALSALSTEQGKLEKDARRSKEGASSLQAAVAELTQNKKDQANRLAAL